MKLKPEDQGLVKLLHEQGYSNIRRLDNGELAGVFPYIFTGGLCVGLGDESYRTRYCYEYFSQAVDALSGWDGTGDPPGPWLKQKPEGRVGPGLTK